GLYADTFGPLCRCPACRAYARHGLLSSDAAPGADGLGPVSVGGLNGAGRALQPVRSIGAVIDVAAVIALALLAYFVREHGRPGFRLALAATILFALALVLWWVVVY